MGDGNHSLATAKAIWERLKAQVGPDHPARYALVEIENIHDEGLEFEPILRVLFDVETRYWRGAEQLLSRDGAAGRPARTPRRWSPWSTSRPGPRARVRRRQAATGSASSTWPSRRPTCRWARIQSFLDAWGKDGGFARIDYVHGKDVAVRLGSQPGNIGIYLPAISKGAFFRTVILDGALPRKTFSMGEAKEKRFYMEAQADLRG